MRFLTGLEARFPSNATLALSFFVLSAMTKFPPGGGLFQSKDQASSVPSPGRRSLEFPPHLKGRVKLNDYTTFYTESKAGRDSAVDQAPTSVVETPLPMSPAVGYICAIASTLLSGSWQAAVKSEPIRRHSLHPSILLVQFSLGFFLASWVALLLDLNGEPFSFTPWGLLAGALFMCSMCLNMAVSFPALGIAIGSGIASSGAVITSLVWSAGVFAQSMRSVALACVGCGFVVLGLNAIIFTGRYFSVPASSGGGSGATLVKESVTEETGLLSTSSLTASSTPTTVNEGDSEVEEPGKSTFICAVVSAIMAGVFGGSYLVPSMSCCADAGIVFLPSMGIGCLLTAPLLSTTTLLLPNLPKSIFPENNILLETAPWGLLGGAISALAIILIIKALDDLDYVVANTLSQTSIFITGLWGWLVFEEFKSARAVMYFFAGAAVLVGGAVIVGIYGTTNN